LEILGFPCNNFNSQEPGTNKEIQKFVRSQGVTFRVLGKLECENGKKTHPLFKFLRTTIPTDVNGPALEWNFVKFLINKDGKPVHRWAPGNMPLTMESVIVNYLPKSAKKPAKKPQEEPGRKVEEEENAEEEVVKEEEGEISNQRRDLQNLRERRRRRNPRVFI